MRLQVGASVFAQRIGENFDPALRGISVRQHHDHAAAELNDAALRRGTAFGHGRAAERPNLETRGHRDVGHCVHQLARFHALKIAADQAGGCLPGARVTGASTKASAESAHSASNPGR